MLKNRHLGSSANDLLKQEGIFEKSQYQAIKEVIAWQIAEAKKRQSLSKARLAVLLKTSRSQIDLLLDPQSDVTLSSLRRATVMVGQTLQVQLV